MARNHATIFPAKLLLFGEYSILLGSSALSMPFNYFEAALKFIQHESGNLRVKAVESNVQLQRMYDYFRSKSTVFEKFLDLDNFGYELSKGIFLASTIPLQYGMGSSGALCAAVYQRYHAESAVLSDNPVLKNIGSLRHSFIQMESFFHGKSSGFDPLVSFLKTPLLLRKNGEAVQVDLSEDRMAENGIDILLVDSGKPCKTGPLVSSFLDEYAPDGHVTSAGYDFCNLVNTTIEKFLSGVSVGLPEEIIRLSTFQMTNLNHLIPESLKQVWAEGLKTGMFSLKLCGSGGGGFLLCFTQKKEETIRYFNQRKIPALSVVGDHAL